MRVLFTCGGTAGHVNPAVALAQMFQTRNSGCEVLFVGADGGMETRLVPKEGYPIETVTITNFRRSLSPASIGHNVRTLLNMNKSRKQANAILDRFQPDLVVGTGGYASFPVVKAAAKRGIPTAVHESNAVPGLTTKTLSKVVDVVMVALRRAEATTTTPERWWSPARRCVPTSSAIPGRRRGRSWASPMTGPWCSLCGAAWGRR